MLAWLGRVELSGFDSMVLHLILFAHCSSSSSRSGSNILVGNTEHRKLELPAWGVSMRLFPAKRSDNNNNIIW